MRIEYRCRYCNHPALLTESGRRWGTRQVVCQNCGARGPLMSSELPSNDIIETLALNANAILAPDEVVVKRATAEHAREVLVCEVACSKSGDDEVCPECEYAITDLTAALEREVGK